MLFLPRYSSGMKVICIAYFFEIAGQRQLCRVDAMVDLG